MIRRHRSAAWNAMICCGAALAMALPGSGVLGEDGGRREFRVVAYLPDYRAAEFDPAQASALTDLVVFSAAPAADGSIDLKSLKRFPWERVRQLKKETRTRLILSIGGWGRSEGFAAVAADAAKRTAFAQSAVRICLDQRLDGIDLDWEHPKTAAEEEAYGKLLADLHSAFEPQGLLLSVTVAGWQKLTAEAIASVDAVQVMSYDHNGRHSTYEDAERDVQTLRDRGVPESKIVLGLPFYGRGITDRSKTATWREIVRREKPTADADEVNGLSFNGPTTIGRKTRLAMTQGLQGVMVWELGQDAVGKDSLLGVIRDEVRRTP